MFYKIENRAQDFTAQVINDLRPLPHIHPHMELIYIQEGVSVATADNKNVLLEAGDLFLSFPNQIHHYHDRTAIKGFLLIFSPDLLKDLKELFYTNVPTSPVIKGKDLAFDATERLDQIVRHWDSDSPFDKIAAKGYLQAFLAETLPLMELIPCTADQDSIKRLLQYCSENYTAPLTLDSVSKELHLNKYYISHVFKERMSIGFTDFINSLRTEHACRLLEKGSNITEIAYSSGFTSIRTFNRVFAENMNMTPREYIRSKESSV